VLTDGDRTPDDTVISEALGDAFSAWKRLEEALGGPELDLKLSWSFYRDGGWLCKALKGSRNMAWLGVWDRYASVTFYFSARHRDDLVNLPIPEALRTEAAEAGMIGTMLPLLIEIRGQEDVDAALEVLRYKLKAT